MEYSDYKLKRKQASQALIEKDELIYYGTPAKKEGYVFNNVLGLVPARLVKFFEDEGAITKVLTNIENYPNWAIRADKEEIITNSGYKGEKYQKTKYLPAKFSEMMDYERRYHYGIQKTNQLEKDAFQRLEEVDKLDKINF